MAWLTALLPNRSFMLILASIFLPSYLVSLSRGCNIEESE